MQPEHTEIEAKFLDIDVGALTARLIGLGASKTLEILYRRKVFDYPDFRLDRDNAWLRLRDEGDKTTLTYKRRLGVSNRDSGQNDIGMEELETTVENFDVTAAILDKCGFILKHYAENRRTRYDLGGVEVDIDEWPLLTPYAEIEAHSWDDIDAAAAALGLNPADKVICSANQLYANQGIRFNDYQVFTFERQVLRQEPAE